MGLKHGLDNATTDDAKALLQTEYDKQAALLQKRNKAYNDFCDENNLKKQNERVTIARWDRKQAAQARAAAKRAEKDLANPKKSGKMKIVTDGRQSFLTDERKP